MKPLFLLLILSLFSTQGIASSCPDGSEPEKAVSADGSYYEYKCPVLVPDYVDKETASPWNFFDNFEDESFDRYIYKSNKCCGRGIEPYKFKKDPDGNTYLEITVKHGWNSNQKHTTERARINPAEKHAIEKVVWYGFKIRLPKDFAHIDDRVLFTQFHNGFEDMNKSPLLGLRFYEGGKRLRIGGDTGRLAHKSFNKPEAVKYKIELDFVKWQNTNKWNQKEPNYKYVSGVETFDTTPLGEWTTYKIGIYNTKTDNGFVKVYKDDVLIFDYEGVTFDWKGSYRGTFISIGPYRDSDPSGKGYPPQSIHYDDFTIVSDKKTLDKYLK
jgi:hypothetical protein